MEYWSSKIGVMMVEAYLVESIYGVFALDENGNIIDKELISREDPELARKLASLEGGELIPEVKSLCERLKKKGITRIVVENEELGRRIKGELGLDVKFELPSKAGRIFREKFVELGVKLGLFKNLEEYIEWLHKVTHMVTRYKVKAVARKRDLFIAQAISAVDEIDRTINLFASRIREWYSLHFPELNDEVRKHQDYIRLVAELGSRSNFTKENLVKLGIHPKKAESIAEKSAKSIGAEMPEFDLEPIRKLARIVLELYELRRSYRQYIDEAMKEVAPNIRELVGPLLGARLIALAGGLEKLARLPASTIQVLGAEKALFRALRTGGKPPKHGVIFQFPYIHRSPRWQRGKIARALACKLAIAARIDAFTGEFKGRELKEELMKRIEEIKTVYAKPPKRRVKERKTRRARRKRK